MSLQEDGRISTVERARLVDFFGEFGASYIIKNLDNLDATFGSATQIILQVMEGKIALKE